MCEERSFFQEVDAAHEINVRRFSDTLNIAVIGSVSSGKSSLINALLNRDRSTMIAPVGAEAGTTVRIHAIKLDEHVRIIDSPGLIDIRQDISDVTIEFLKFVDVGILVVTGSADAVQRQHLRDLREVCAATFVALNKIDQWDRHKPEAIEKVEAQWKIALDIGSLFKVCCFGYDPDTACDAPLDLRGISDMRREIEAFLAYKGKDLLLARHIFSKEETATKIISAALVGVAAGSFAPGAAVIVATVQLGALYSLYYLYTGKILTKGAATGVLLSLGGQAAVTQLFVLVKSFLPPTGIADFAAAYGAVVFSFAMLAAFTKVLSRGSADIRGEELTKEFKAIRGRMKALLSDSNPVDWRNGDFWGRLIRSSLFS